MLYFILYAIVIMDPQCSIIVLTLNDCISKEIKRKKIVLPRYLPFLMQFIPQWRSKIPLAVPPNPFFLVVQVSWQWILLVSNDLGMSLFICHYWSIFFIRYRNLYWLILNGFFSSLPSGFDEKLVLSWITVRFR